jgi:hypothetical protein
MDGEGVPVMIGKKARNVTDPRTPARPERWRIPPIMLIRMFVIGSVAVIACIWAIWRHYAVPRPPLLVPTPAPSATEIEVEPPP